MLNLIRKLGAKLYHRWFFGFIVTLVLSACLFFFGDLVAFGMGNARLGWEGIKTVILLLFGLYFLLVILDYSYSRYRAWRLRRQLSDTVGLEQSQSQRQIEAVTKRFSDSVSVLESRQGKKALVQLPWYLVIGSPGAGKTLLLANSGLTYPAEQKSGERYITGFGGTDNCKLWLSEQAILVDTAGRYVQQPEVSHFNSVNSDSTATSAQSNSDKDEWLAFLGVLQKNRSQQPINGLIVVQSLEDLLYAGQSSRTGTSIPTLETQARQLKSRIAEIQTVFGLTVPIYLFISKCDLLPGFESFFKQRNTVASRREIWGAHFDNAEVIQKGLQECVDSNLQSLYQLLLRQALQQIQEGTDLPERQAIQAFPEMFVQVIEPLNRLVAQVFSGTDISEAYRLQGLYFTSATQEATVLQRLFADMCADIGLDVDAMQHSALSGGQQATDKSYFIHDLIQKKIIPEQHIVGLSSRWLRFKSLLFKSVVAGSVGLSLVMSVGWALSFYKNQNFLTVANARLAASDVASISVEGDSDQAQESILKQLNALKLLTDGFEKEREAIQFSGRLGLNKANAIAHNAQQQYENNLVSLLYPWMVSRILEELAVENSEHQDRVHYLRYLAILSPTSFGEPAVRWASQENKRKKLKQELAVWFQHYAPAAFTDHVKALLDIEYGSAEFDQKILARHQAALRQMPEAKLLYLLLIQKLDSDHPVLSLKSKSQADCFNQNPEHIIPGRYTYSSALWMNDNSQLKAWLKQTSKMAWLWGAESAKFSSQALLPKLQSQFSRDYSKTWDKTLLAFHIQAFSTANKGLDVLSGCIVKPSPMEALLDKVARHTQFELESTPQSTSKAKAVLNALPSSRVKSNIHQGMRLQDQVASDAVGVSPTQYIHQHFAALNALSTGDPSSTRLGEILSALSHIQTALSEQSFSGGRHQGSAELTPSLQVLDSLKRQALREPQPVAQWLQELSHNSGIVIVAQQNFQVADVVKVDWNQTVQYVCDAITSDLYPFNKNSLQDVSLAQMTKLLGPGELLETFRRDSLGSAIRYSRGQFRWASDAVTLARHLPSSILKTLNRANTLQAAFFPMPLKIRLYPLDLSSSLGQFTLEVGNKKLTYAHGPRENEVAIEWPTQQSDRVVLSVLDLEGNRLSAAKRYRGQWSLLRAVEDATVLPTGNTCVQRYGEALCQNMIKVRWQLSAGTVDIGIQAESLKNPFSVEIRNALSRFRCDQ